MKSRACAIILVLAALTVVPACSGTSSGRKASTPTPAGTPVVKLANSLYTSWNAFFAAAEIKDENGELLFDERPGYQGVYERKWGVDLVQSQLDYDKAIEAYGNGTYDMVTITNMDALQPSLSRKSVVIMPNSTSFGADAMVVAGRITDPKQLKKETLHLLEKSVSEYCFDRNLRLLGEDPKEYKYSSMTPEAIAPAMQQKQEGFDAAMLWNPPLQVVLKTRKDCRVIFDSTKIPGEIIDTVVMSEDSLKKPGGREAACCVVDIYYAMCRRLADPKTHAATKLALGAKFGGLNEQDMDMLLRQTRFYATPEQGLALMTGGVTFPWESDVKDTAAMFGNTGFDPAGKGVGKKTLKDVMPTIVQFCVDHEIVQTPPTVGYGTGEEAGDVRLRFDPSFIKEAVARK